MRSYTWLHRVVCTDPLQDNRGYYEGRSHPVFGSGRSSTSTASFTKDCTGAGAPATLACNFSATAGETSML